MTVLGSLLVFVILPTISIALAATTVFQDNEEKS